MDDRMTTLARQAIERWMYSSGPQDELPVSATHKLEFEITAALTEAVTREREECAKLCDADPADSEMRSYGKYFASAIRARTPPLSGQE
jgi:hypothetical protein